MQMAISVGAYFFIFRQKYGTNLKKNCAGLKSPASPGVLCPPSELGQCDCCGDGGVERLRAGVICRIRGDEKTA